VKAGKAVQRVGKNLGRLIGIVETLGAFRRLAGSAIIFRKINPEGRKEGPVP